MTNRRRMFEIAAAAAMCVAVAWPAGAQAAFPERPVTLIVPFPAGGSTDLVARVVAEKMSASLGQQIVVDNRGGAGGNVGSAAAAKAEADGYTILMGTVATHALNPALYKKMPYDPVADFAPISLLVVVIYLVASIWTGAKAPRNPWGGSSLEWQAPTPPTLYNFETPPVVYELYNYDDIVEVEEDRWERRPASAPAAAEEHK